MVTQGHSSDKIRSAAYDFILTFHSNHRPISYHFPDKRRDSVENRKFCPPRLFTAHAEGLPLILGNGAWAYNTRINDGTWPRKKFHGILSRFDTIYGCNRQTGKRTHRHRPPASTAVSHIVVR